MKPWLDDGDVQIHVGDALDVLRGMPDGSVDLIATSPPFYALRDYGVEGQIGLEATPEEWAARLVEVFGDRASTSRRRGGRTRAGTAAR